MKVLAALDLTAHSGRVLAEAAALARHGSGRLWLLHVAAPDPEFIGYDVGPQAIRDARSVALHKEHQMLQDWASDVRADGVDCTALLIQGPSAEVILAQAERLFVDYVVLGSRRHSLVASIVLGSVCDQVVGKSSKPVLLVPLPE